MAAAALVESPLIHRSLRWTLCVAGALAVLAAALFFGVPAALRHLLETNLAAQIHRSVSVGRIAFNPLTLVARIDDLTVQSATAGAQPLLHVDTLALDVSIASIWHRAPVLDRVTIDNPRLAIVRNADGSYGVQDLVDAALAGRGGAPARFSLNNIEVHGGAIDFDDRPRQRKHEVRDLNIGIPFLSSLAYQTTIKVAPHVSARVNGSAFSLAGTTTPFAATRDASLDIDIDSLSLAQYLEYLPFKLRAKVVSGTLTSRAKLVFSEGDPQSRALWLSGEIVLNDLVLRRAGGVDAVSIPRADAHVARLDVFHRRLVMDSLHVERPVIGVRRAADGTLDLTQPWIDAPAAAVAGGPSARWRVDVEKAEVTDGVIRVEDNAVRPAYRATFGVGMDATDLSSADTQRAHLRVSLTSEFGASASADVDLIPATLEASGHVAIDKLSLRRFHPYYAHLLDVDMQAGSLSVAGDFTRIPASAPASFTVSAGEATLDDVKLALHGEAAPLLRVPRVSLTGIAVDVAARSIAIGKVASRGGALKIRREPDGSVNLARVLAPSRADVRDPAHAEPDWAVTAKAFVFDHYAIAIDDALPASPVAFEWRDVALTATNVSTARDARMDVALHAEGDGGTLKIDGPVSLHPLDARLHVDADGLALAPLQPYLDPYIDVTVTGGTLAAIGRLAFTESADAADSRRVRSRWSGDVVVSDFVALDTPARGDLARWKRLALTGVDAVAEPFRLDIAGVALDDYFARVILARDATLNWASLLKPRSASPATGAASASATRPAAVTGVETLPVSIGRITLARGHVRYTDFYVRPNYAADLTDVGGSVSSMSPTQAGIVDLAAKVQQTAPVSIKGTLNPFATPLALDLAAKARNVDLPPLSPYAIKYAGYAITKGSLAFDASYKVEDRKLIADNKLVVDQLTFGDHVDSPTATKLPVQLAVALLKDARGVIDIDLPIAGSLDDPQFSVGALIGRVIVNLLEKAVTSPFALLGAAIGGGGEELSYVGFVAGTDHVASAGDAKLDKLAHALAARPALAVDITGRNDVAADTQALVRAAVERSIRAAKVKALVAAGTPPADADAVVVGADERPRYLAAAYKDAPIDERPRNFFGFLKEVPAAEMEAMLLAHARIGTNALPALAQGRAQAVKTALVTRGVAAQRLFVVAADSGAPTPGTPAARADLALH